MWGFPLELLLVKILVGFLTRFDLRKFELRISGSQPDLGLIILVTTIIIARLQHIIFWGFGITILITGTITTTIIISKPC